MKATFHMIMNGDNTKAQSTTQQYLPDDAFFCPHPELCMVRTCQKAPQYLAPPLSTGTREGAHLYFIPMWSPGKAPHSTV